MDISQYKVTAKEVFLFEIRSFLGRNLARKKPILFENSNYLNLGCADSIKKGYVNADFYPSFKLWKKTQLQWKLDLRYPLQCPENLFDGIFTEHTLEHLYPDEVKELLSELYRILKPNAIIRITVPDLRKYVDYYTHNLSESLTQTFDARFNSECHAIQTLTQNYHHHSLWDFEEMQSALKECGFRDIVEMTHGNSNDPKLALDRHERSWETLYIEAKK